MWIDTKMWIEMEQNRHHTVRLGDKDETRRVFHSYRGRKDHSATTGGSGPVRDSEFEGSGRLHIKGRCD